jgi:hypothetical protein
VFVQRHRVAPLFAAVLEIGQHRIEVLQCVQVVSLDQQVAVAGGIADFVLHRMRAQHTGGTCSAARKAVSRFSQLSVGMRGSACGGGVAGRHHGGDRGLDQRVECVAVE